MLDADTSHGVRLLIQEELLYYYVIGQKQDLKREKKDLLNIFARNLIGHGRPVRCLQIQWEFFIAAVIEIFAA